MDQGGRGSCLPAPDGSTVLYITGGGFLHDISGPSGGSVWGRSRAPKEAFGISAREMFCRFAGDVFGGV